MERSALALSVEVLGPLVLRVQGAAVDVVGSRRRAVLALLALEGDRGLSTERLVDSLWPDSPPGNAV
jgi:DNA-binding SARP family transcriptional activator